MKSTRYGVYKDKLYIFADLKKAHSWAEGNPEKAIITSNEARKRFTRGFLDKQRNLFHLSKQEKFIYKILDLDENKFLPNTYEIKKSALSYAAKLDVRAGKLRYIVKQVEQQKEFEC